VARANDPEMWNRGDVEEFALRATPDEIQAITRSLAATGDRTALQILKSFLFARGGTTFEKRLPAVLAGRALLQAGPPGVEVLADAIMHGPRPRYVSTLVMTLWRAAHGDYAADALLEGFEPRLETVDPPAGTDEAARRAITDYVADALVNPKRFGDIGIWLQQLAITPEADPTRPEAISEIGSLLADASIRLSRSLLDEYAALIAAAEREETYQRFLTAHPTLLDPLAATILPKLRLGTEYATDFAVRRHDNRWLLVEIEKPQDAIFTTQGNFSAAFTHAYGQVLDFQRWVDDDVAYARKSMPEIAIPRGLLVMGRRTTMSDRQQKKLAQLVSNSARVDVVTFDDLLHQATVVYENLYRRWR
jgi:hypothetical protein